MSPLVDDSVWDPLAAFEKEITIHVSTMILIMVVVVPPNKAVAADIMMAMITTDGDKDGVHHRIVFWMEECNLC